MCYEQFINVKPRPTLLSMPVIVYDHLKAIFDQSWQGWAMVFPIDILTSAQAGLFKVQVLINHKTTTKNASYKLS